MENLKISFIAYCLFSEFFIFRRLYLDRMRWVIFLCLMKTKIMYLIYFQIIKRICWKGNVSFVCMYDGSYGSKYDEYSQQSKIKREIPKSNKSVIIENIKVNVIPYRITNKTGRLSLLLFTVLMEGIWDQTRKGNTDVGLKKENPAIFQFIDHKFIHVENTKYL